MQYIDPCLILRSQAKIQATVVDTWDGTLAYMVSAVEKKNTYINLLTECSEIFNHHWIVSYETRFANFRLNS